jgi:hypothetical protein
MCEVESCRCRGAVLTAYRELTARGQSDCRAVEACRLVFLCHHPGAGRGEAVAAVRSWLDAAQAAAR